jgi:two-component sensor histidine kinase
VKNILAVVQALAMQTGGRISSVEEFRKSLVGRVQALSRAHSLLLDTNWRSADLGMLIEQMVNPYRSDRPDTIQIAGELLALTPSQGLGLSLVMHELATNAAKYGALSHPEGLVHVSWHVEEANPGRRVRLLWQERGGPPVQAPSEKGFGMRLIERACTYELGGTVELDCSSGGLRWELVFPLT